MNYHSVRTVAMKNAVSIGDLGKKNPELRKKVAC
jgi:hypothetical protein